MRKNGVLGSLLVTVFILSGMCHLWADPIDPYRNVQGGGEMEILSAPMEASSITLPFDPNNFSFLIYDCGGGENSIHGAMQKIGITNYTTRNAANQVTLNDLQSNDILIVGWSAGGDKSGLEPDIIEQGITGRVILSGHDSDYHTVNVETEDAATTFFIQEIEYVLQNPGTGLIVCADIDSNFDWIPTSWGIDSEVFGGTEVTDFTQEGESSGVYDDLTPELMSNWSTSFHNYFKTWGVGFRPFEMGLVSDANSVITIAAPVNPYGFPFDKTDDVAEGDCISPNDEIRYTICWNNSTGQSFTDVWIIDYLPEGVSYPEGAWSLDPNDPNMVLLPPDPGYDPETHSYAWPIGDIGPGSSGCRELRVVVNEKAEPGMNLHNIAEIWSGDTLLTRATEDTPVCCWDAGNIIYVDGSANGNNNGLSWTDAYTDFQDALSRARNSSCPQQFIIYVAQGTYKPGPSLSASFELPVGISVYGGFPNGGCEFNLRSPKHYNTVLSGNINDTSRNKAIVIMGDETLLDGFTVTGADFGGYGIYGSGSDFTIQNCVITDNWEYGIRAADGNITVRWCDVKNNGSDGIRHEGVGFTLYVENCRMMKNMRRGIYCVNSSPVVLNSIVSESDMSRSGNAGIRMINPTYMPVLYNNTFAHNKNVGISFVDNGTVSDPNSKDYPDVQNCILWYNNANTSQVSGFPKQYIYHSCIYDPNDPNGMDLTRDLNYNFSANPKFAYFDPNNVHITYESPCKDAGSPWLDYTDQVDMDSRIRVAGAAVDVGAYEIDCEDTSNELDWNHDGLVNYHEFSKFSAAWLSHDPNDPVWIADPNLADPNLSEAWNPLCNLDATGTSAYVIDLADLEAFVFDIPWLWRACWLTDIESFQTTSGGDQMLALSGDFIGTQSLQAASEPVPEPELSIADPVVQLEDSIAFLEQLWLEDPTMQQEIDAQLWQDFMEAVYSSLHEMQTYNVQTE